jgi:hypothetical protein
MSKISVITPTIREAGLDVVNIALKRQTFKDFEWLIGSSFKPQYGTWIEDDFTGGVWTLNRIYNKLIKAASGDIIVSIQDFTFFNPDTLKRFYYHLNANPAAVISGIGDKYQTVYPLPQNKLWSDPRRTGDTSLRRCFFNEIEGNFCSLSKKTLEEIGGFDESLDFMGYGMDWYGVLDRLNIADNNQFFIDESIESYSLTHGRVKDWEDKNLIHGLYDKVKPTYLENPKLKFIP